jgi:hypothetical protein
VEGKWGGDAAGGTLDVYATAATLKSVYIAGLGAGGTALKQSIQDRRIEENQHVRPALFCRKKLIAY